MTDKQTYWLVDETGKKALVEGAVERDRFKPLGWADTTEPAGDEFVYHWLDGVTVPALFPAGSLEVWQAKGWKPGPPPEPVSPFNGDQAVAVAPQSAPSPAEQAEAPSKSKAAAGDAKEK